MGVFFVLSFGFAAFGFEVGFVLLLAAVRVVFAGTVVTSWLQSFALAAITVSSPSVPARPEDGSWIQRPQIVRAWGC